MSQNMKSQVGPFINTINNNAKSHKGINDKCFDQTNALVHQHLSHAIYHRRGTRSVKNMKFAYRAKYENPICTYLQKNTTMAIDTNSHEIAQRGNY